MMHGLIATMLAIPSGWACGDKNASSSSASCPEETKPPAPADRAHPGRRARSTQLMGAGNCSWSTSLMAQRVLSEGQPYTYVGTLQESDNELSSRVAAPYTVGPDSSIHVIANEVLDTLREEFTELRSASPHCAPGRQADSGCDFATSTRLELRGKVLTVDTIQYLVVTEINRGSS